MLRILIADDEYFFRQYLKSCLHWEAEGFSIVGEAANGDDALALLGKLAPDVALLDINMPLQSGLDISRFIFEHKLPIKVVILTGHVEFKFAQQALQYGVRRYLLKPLNTEELIDTLHDLRREQEQESRYRVRLQDLEENLERNRPKLREKLLDELLADRQGNQWDSEAAREVGINLSGPAYTVVSFTFDQLTREDVTFREWELWKYAVCNIAAELFTQMYHTSHVCELEDQMLFLLEHSAELNTDITERICHEICNHVQSLLDYSVSAGIGCVVDTVDQICVSCQQALLALRSRTIDSYARVLLYGQTRTGAAPIVVSLEKKKDLLLLLHTGNTAAVTAFIDELFTHLGDTTSNELIGACVELISLCLEFGLEFSVNPSDQLPERQSPYELAQFANTASKAKELVTAMLQNTIAEVFAKTQKPGGLSADEIKTYIDEHFTQAELKITQIADALHITYHHLCRSFKSNTGITLNQYITDKRLTHARALIENGHGNVSLIAQQSGFNDAGYFSKCFKRAVGLSPSRYIQLLRGETGI